jgi:hypothetical protein
MESVRSITVAKVPLPCRIKPDGRISCLCSVSIASASDCHTLSMQVLAVTRTHYHNVCNTFPIGARTTLENLGEHAEQVDGLCLYRVLHCNIRLAPPWVCHTASPEQVWLVPSSAWPFAPQF